MSETELNLRNGEFIDFLLSRRSVIANLIKGPGPTQEDLQKIVQAAMRVPDHGRLEPWRMLVLRDQAREELGHVLKDAFVEENPKATEVQVNYEQNRLTRAPVVVAVVSKVLKDHKIPEWEQILSSGAACQTMLIAAQSMGYAAQWLTEWYAYHPAVSKALNLEENERIAGFVYIGSGKAPSERDRPEYENVVTEVESLSS